MLVCEDKMGCGCGGKKKSSGSVKTGQNSAAAKASIISIRKKIKKRK